jgi:hypothetical protein
LRGGKSVPLAIAVCLLADGALVRAHRADEYLQAARIDIEPGRVGLELDLTPGIAVARAVVDQIDRNHDGRVSTDEQAAYERRVLEEVGVQIDGRAVQLRLTASRFPALDAFGRGEGTIRLQSAAVFPALSGGAHQLRFRNTHRRDVSVYLANALVPASARIAISAQHRDGDQSELLIDFAAR